MFTTSNPDAFKQKVSELRAGGGGDGPEMGYHGMRSAVLNVRPGSTCYVYTDAGPKDEYLKPEVLTLAGSKHVTVSNVLDCACVCFCLCLFLCVFMCVFCKT